MERIEAIERATLAAVPPEREERWNQWLLALDRGTVGRAHSAVPLQHAPPPGDSLEQIELRYRSAGLAPVFRVPELQAFDALRQDLQAGGYVRAKPTLVQTGDVRGLAGGRSAGADLQLAETATPEWEDVFLGDGFDPVDGASRLEILRRGRNSIFASARVDGRTVAAGSACLLHGWCGIHGLRTALAYRGRGLAGALLSALAEAALQRGVSSCFLQVEQANDAARTLYARRGFTTAWPYAYWKKP